MRTTLIKHLVLLLPWLYTVTACGTSGGDNGYAMPDAPDYADRNMWYKSADTLTGNRQADVFYVTPTCVWDWQDSDGQTCHYMNVRDSAQRAATDAATLLAHSLFSPSCRFFSPYYRQITMESWSEPSEEIERRYQQAHVDVTEAFRYYMEHYNNGRPFILAGHSQGAKAVIELLKHTVTDEQRARMVAAYVFGYSVSKEELADFPALRPATGADDTGVIICYNSVSRPDALSPLFASNTVCINPINWRTDSVYAPASANLGSVFFDAAGKSDTLRHKVGARIDTSLHTLIIDGLRDEDYHIPSIAGLFPKGNYHVQEINLYFLNLQQNIRQRIASFH